MGAGGHQNGYSVGRSGQIAAPSRLTSAGAAQNTGKVGRWISHRPTPAASSRHPTSTPQVPHKLNPNQSGVARLVLAIGERSLSVSEMLSALQLKDRKSFLELYLSPAIKLGLMKMLYPESPRHPRQRYLLTPQGHLGPGSGRSWRRVGGYICFF